MSMILSKGSIETGQWVTHAMQDVQDQISSAVMASASNGRSLVWVPEPLRPLCSIWLRISCITLRGDKGFAAREAGQFSSQRPQDTQASDSSNCFQVKSLMVRAPTESASSETGIAAPRIPCLLYNTF